MQSRVPLAGLTILTAGLLFGCSDPNGSDDNDDGGESGTGTGGNGGTSGLGGTSGGGGTAGGGGSMCSNADPSTLPIDEGGWVARECNNRMIQGAFYCYDDGKNPTSCPPAAADGTRPPPYRAGAGMCISGNTTVDPTFAAWGAGLGLGLNESGGMGSTKTAYNATANGVTGFHLDLTGSTGGLPLRVGFTTSATPTGAQPFVQVPGGTMSVDVAIADALVPTSWTTDPNAGLMANPSAIYDMQVQIAGGDAAAAYDFCIAKITPIAMGGPGPGTVPPYGMQNCQPLGTIDLPGRYMVQNNVYNAGGGQQCVTAGWDNGANAGFTVSPVSLNVAAGSAPASYPSVVLGWHYGRFYGSYMAAKTLGTIASIPSNWAFTTPALGRYNASYDAWIHPTNANPATPNGGVELMIWLSQRDTTPIGTMVGTVDLGGATWAVWFGPNAGGWTTVSYVRAGNTTSVTNLDLLPFFVDAAQRGYTTAASYLLGVEAGFEIWEQTMPMVSNSYSVAIN